VVVLKVTCHLSDRVLDADLTTLDILGDTIIQWLCNHGDLVFLIWCDGVAHDSRGLDDSFAEARDRVRHLDFHLRVQSTEIMEYTIHVELASTQDHMLTRLFHFGGY